MTQAAVQNTPTPAWTVPMDTTNTRFLDAAHALVASAERCPAIRFSNRDTLVTAVATLLEAGPSKLHCIFDFDMTLTRYWIVRSGSTQRVRNYSSHSVIALSNRTSPRFKQTEEALFKRYYPIEVDPSIPLPEKIPHMLSWWSESHENILQEKLTRGDFRAMAASCPLVWREDVPELFTALHRAEIPTLVFSAGVAETIRAVLAEAGLLLDNVHVVSNEIVFDPAKSDDDPSAVAVAVKEPFIHVFNKGEVAIRDTPFYQTVCPPERDNVILVGDSLGDIHMKDGVHHSADLTVGILSHDVDNLLDKYLDKFKIVFTDDIGLFWLNELVTQIVRLHTK